MRTVKFRGQRVDNGEWIIGGLVIPDILLRGAWICPSTTFADLYPDLEEGENISNYKYNGITIGHFHEVRPETVGQFTGLTDENGKEIFENDIVEFVGGTCDFLPCGIYDHHKHEIGKKLIVQNLDSGFTLAETHMVGCDIPNMVGKVGNYDFWNHHRSLVVIGNIFQNSDLLK